jgi:hypothetical protein
MMSPFFLELPVGLDEEVSGLIALGICEGWPEGNMEGLLLGKSEGLLSG